MRTNCAAWAPGAPEPSTGAARPGYVPAEGLKHIDRYRIEGVLGSGAFGQVYQAYDEELQRYVAIKVPHRERLASAHDVDRYLAEARVLARDGAEITPAGLSDGAQLTLEPDDGPIYLVGDIAVAGVE